jgi:molybdenum cofactor sulfurtransferase
VSVCVCARARTADVSKLLNVISRFFVERGPRVGSAGVLAARSTEPPLTVSAPVLSVGSTAEPAPAPAPALVLTRIALYPIKSCGAQVVERWPLGARGLMWDREFAVVSSSGRVLNQKQVPRLALVQPTVIPASRVLRLTAPGMMEPMELSLDAPAAATALDDSEITVSVCGGDAAAATGASMEAADAWFSRFLGVRVLLVRRSCAPARPQRGLRGTGSFANEGDVLLISEESVAELSARMRARRPGGGPLAECPVADLFRANLVVRAGAAFAEDSWTAVRVGAVRARVTGSCARCRMVNIDQASAAALQGGGPLLVLAEYRRQRGNIMFGRFLSVVAGDDASAAGWVAVGDTISVIGVEDAAALGAAAAAAAAAVAAAAAAVGVVGCGAE